MLSIMLASMWLAHSADAFIALSDMLAGCACLQAEVENFMCKLIPRLHLHGHYVALISKASVDLLSCRCNCGTHACLKLPKTSAWRHAPPATASGHAMAMQPVLIAGPALSASSPQACGMQDMLNWQMLNHGSVLQTVLPCLRAGSCLCPWCPGMAPVTAIP